MRLMLRCGDDDRTLCRMRWLGLASTAAWALLDIVGTLSTHYRLGWFMADFAPVVGILVLCISGMCIAHRVARESSVQGWFVAAAILLTVSQLQDALSDSQLGSPLFRSEIFFVTQILFTTLGTLFALQGFYAALFDAHGTKIELARERSELISEAAERERIEQALRESEARSRALLLAVPDRMYLIRDDGEVIDLRMHEATTGEDARTPQDKAMAMALRRKAAQECHRQALRSSTIQVMEFDSRNEEEERHWEARFAASGDSETLVIVRDTTERHRLEREVLAASSREQRRIGRDLHDGLGQHLTGILCLSSGIACTLSEKGLSEAEDAAEIGRMVKQAINQTRALAKGLSPVVLEANGLEAALGELALHVVKIFGISCVFEGRVYGGLGDAGVSEELYRIAQEAVSNAVKHSQAEQIVMTLESNESGTVLTVKDDGIGIPGGDWQSKGMGLRNMVYRARMIGATLEIRRNPSGGTAIVCIRPGR